MPAFLSLAAAFMIAGSPAHPPVGLAAGAHASQARQDQPPRAKTVRVVRRPAAADQPATKKKIQKKTGPASDRPTKSVRPTRAIKGKPAGVEGVRAIKRRPILVKPANPNRD